MATIHQVTLSPGKDELLAGWIGEQRWYAAKGSRPRLRRLDSWRLDDPAGEVGIETLVYRDETGPAPVTYQVPLTYRGAPLEGAEHALVGEAEHPVLGHRWIYDGPHDPVYVTQLLALLRGRVTAQHGSLSDTPQPDVVGAPHPAWPENPVVRESRVLRGEQSNTSVIVTTDERPVIVKVFRTLAPGENPDITLQGALAASHSPFVPASVGHVAGSWRRADGDGDGVDVGQLAFAQEFLPGTRDAWRVCLEEAAAGRSFAGPAYELGAATAHIHASLARVMPTTAATPQEVSRRVDAMRRRAAVATSEVPSLIAHEDAARAALDAAERVAWPPLQRIHGDYHLGQVLDVPGRGWVAIDFEGEPLRPLAERNTPDSPMRDVAGMLRSFDYAGASVATRPEDADRARAWVVETQDAFLDGYARIAGDPRDQPELLRAHLLDKALYEVVYESRNRPTWLPIPTAAVDRILQEATA